MYIDADTVLTAAKLVTAVGALGGVVVWCIRFVDRQKKQGAELVAIQRELVVICRGLRACLQGLKEQGCDGPVEEALDFLNKHLNGEAHDHPHVLK